ncbi:MAG: hypothetical protein OQK11_05550 [Thiovulaceae bacterium]|nr:hypothetical protein [Sulfurimonadaceae bacterium]
MKKNYILFLLSVFVLNIFASEAPEWINNPDMGGNVGSVGIVKVMKNKRKQNYIAKKLDVASLQERKRVMMESSIEKKDSELISSIKQSSSHFNDYEVVQKAEYSDGENYYVWVVIKR